MENKSKNRFLLFLIFVVNFLALTFQVVWVRETMTVFGSSALSVSTVLSVFLGGIALGSYFGGRLVGKVREKYKVAGYALISLGFYCLFLPFIIDFIDFPFSFIRDFISNPIMLNFFKFLICSIVLIVPTTIIGAMFPVITYLFSTNSNNLGTDVASVYFFDTLGAALGSLLCGFVFVPFLGLMETTIFSSLVFIVFGYFLYNMESEFSYPAAEEIIEPFNLDGRQIFILFMLFVSGFSAILLEVIWIRFFNLIFSSSIYGFSLVVASFLLGLSVGSFIMRQFMGRIGKPEIVFAYISMVIAFFSMIVIMSYEYLKEFYFFVFNNTNNFYIFEATLFFACFIIILIPTILMGANFPLAVRIFSRDNEHRGEDTGIVFSFNTAGGILGSFVAGFFIIPNIGLWQSSLVASVIYIVIGATFLFVFIDKPLRQLVMVLFVSAVLIPIFFLKKQEPGKELAVYYAAPRYSDYDSYMEDTKRYSDIFSKQGFYGFVSVSRHKELKVISLRNNGKTDASTGDTDVFNQSMIGHTAFFFHKNPKKILNIGLGGGFTLSAINAHQSVETIDSVEIDPLVVEAVKLHFGPYNNNALLDPRHNLDIEDGRLFLDTTKNKYDIIVSEPPNIWVSGVSRLFTREFYESVSNHLNEGGILIQWVPAYEMDEKDFILIANTLRERFKYIKYWSSLVSGDVIFMASHEDYRGDNNFIKNILADEAVYKNIFGDLEFVNYQELFDYILDYKEVNTSDYYVKSIKKFNRDNLPYLEFTTARNLYYFQRNSPFIYR